LTAFAANISRDNFETSGGTGCAALFISSRAAHPLDGGHFGNMGNRGVLMTSY
jgi:hypothetical protein